MAAVAVTAVGVVVVDDNECRVSSSTTEKKHLCTGSSVYLFLLAHFISMYWLRLYLPSVASFLFLFFCFYFRLILPTVHTNYEGFRPEVRGKQNVISRNVYLHTLRNAVKEKIRPRIIVHSSMSIVFNSTWYYVQCYAISAGKCYVKFEI